MTSISFELPDGHTALSGLAVVLAADSEGKLYIFTPALEGTPPIERIGLLAAALDQIRYTFIDKDADPGDVLGNGHE